MTQRLLLLALAVFLAALGAVAVVMLREGAEPRRDELVGPSAATPTATAELAPAVEAAAPRQLTAEEQAAAAELATTVVVPLKLEFEVVAAAGRLSAPNASPLGSDATARLTGSAHDAAGLGVEGEVEFVAGPNAGRVLPIEGGRFGANDLYAGLSLARVHGRGVPGALREVLLREGRSAQLNLGFGRAAAVYGTVVDRANQPLAGVHVQMDGQERETDEQGVFYFPAVAGGKVPLYLSKPGFADLRALEPITAGMTIAIGKLKYVLDRGASLRVSLPDRVGTGAPAQVILSTPFEPQYGGQERKYPWHLKNPTTLYAGESVEIDGLPAGRVRVQVYQPGATATPATQEVTLVAGETSALTFQLEAAPLLTGRVLIDGKPAHHALVQLEMPDLTGASVVARGGALGRAQTELDLMDHAPATRQRVFTAADGTFTLSANEDLSAVRYLTARSDDGRLWGGRAVQPGEREVELTLEPARDGDVTLTIETSTRHQALPVEYVVDGRPYAVVLPAGERLVIEGLGKGAWRYSARWGGEDLQKPTVIELDGDTDLFVPLPEGAVKGQPRELIDSMKAQHARGGRRG
ncbi:MAG: carboxypeptidase regulatory-like domain-containing protein [Planctomycetes bacterium]|nr:carboxypeptidase regulatory-like domain-containing protein [Planctomycetota bacterium]